jgi:hypothetical protein
MNENTEQPTPYEAYRRAKADREFRPEAERIIEEAAEDAYQMVRDCGSPREWAERIIERAGDTWVAIKMVEDCGSSREWLRQVGK